MGQVYLGRDFLNTIINQGQRVNDVYCGAEGLVIGAEICFRQIVAMVKLRTLAMILVVFSSGFGKLK